MKIITVDGPSGVGKGTLCKSLAKKLGYAYLDTGSQYRATTLQLLKTEKEFSEEKAITAAKALNPKRLSSLLQDPELRGPEVSNLVARVAKVQPVRLEMRKLSQDFAKNPPLLENGKPAKGVVLDGRDTGTLVVPNADHKFYLTARPEVCAKRRFEDYKERGREQPFEKVLQDVIDRDEMDKKNPMIPDPTSDMIHIDSSDLNKEEVLERVLSYLK